MTWWFYGCGPARGLTTDRLVGTRVSQVNPGGREYGSWRTPPSGSVIGPIWVTSPPPDDGSGVKHDEMILYILSERRCKQCKKT